MNASRHLKRAGLLLAAVVTTAVSISPAAAQTTTTWQSGNWLTGTWSNGVAGPNDTAVIGNTLTMNVSGTVMRVIMGMTNSNQGITIANGGSFVVDGGLGEFSAGANTGSITVTQTNANAANVIQAASVRARGLTVSSTSASTTAYLTIAAGQLYSPNNGSTPNGNVLIGSAADRNGHITLSGTLNAANLTFGVATGSGTAALVLEGGTLLMSNIVRSAGGTARFDFKNGKLSARSAALPLALSSNAATPLQVALGASGSRIVDSDGGLVNVLSTAQFVDGDGAGSLTKAGTGTLVIQGTNTYSGDTVIESGTLRMENVVQQVLSGTAGGTNNRTISGLVSTAGLFVGQEVSGANIGASARIASIGTNSVTLTVNGTGGATTATFAAAYGGLHGTTLNYDNQGGFLSFGQSTAMTLGGLKGGQNLALANDALSPVALSLGGNNQSTSYAGVLSGGGSLEKLGAGTLTLSGSSTFSGATAVNAGKLVVNGALANTSGMTVAGAAALGGSGSINGLTTVDGMLTPGNSPGILTFDSLLLGSSASTIIEIQSAGVRGTAYDGITVLDADGLTYGGSLTFAFGGSALADNTLFDIFDFVGTPSGNFTTLTSTGFYDGTWSSIGGGQWQSSKGSQTLTFSQAEGTLVIVPEPDTVIFAGIGIAMAGWSLWKRRRIARILQK